MRGPELQTPDVDPRGAGSRSKVRARAIVAVALLGLGLAPGPAARVARAQDPGGPPDCGRAEVAEAIWLRDEEPQEAPPGGPANGTQLDDGTRFSLAVVIGDLLLLREESGTASWPRTLSRLSSQELRARRDAPALDATACEIVRFMRDYYSAERERDGGPPVQRPATPEPASAPSAPPPPRRETAPAPARPPEREPARASAPSPASAAAPPAAPTLRGPAPAANAPRVSSGEVGTADPVPSPRLPDKKPTLTAATAEAWRSREPTRLEPPATDEETPPPPPAVAPPEARLVPTPAPAPAPTPGESEPPAPADPPALAPVDPAPEAPIPIVVEPEPPAPEPSGELASAAAKQDLAELDAQLSAPRYLTLRAIRRNGSSRPDDEVWRMRRQTLEARDEVVKLLRKLAGDPTRFAAMKALLGAQGCTRTEKRIRELYAGGPDTEKGELALQLWKRQPDPD